MNGWVIFDETPDEEICPDCGYHHRHSAGWHEPGDPLVTVVAFWPVSERHHDGFDNRWTSRCYLRTACAHAHYNLQIIEDPSEAKIPPGLPVIALEEPYALAPPKTDTGYRNTEQPPEVIELHQYDHPINCTYILGNTYYRRPSEHFAVDECIGLTLDDNEIGGFSPLYAAQMISLIWYDRRLKLLQLEAEDAE